MTEHELQKAIDRQKERLHLARERWFRHRLSEDDERIFQCREAIKDLEKQMEAIK